MLAVNSAMTLKKHHGTDQHGFTLLEVLVALAVLMIGMIAIAMLQTTGLSYNNSAYLRSQAIIQAHDMADRIYANPDGVASGAYGTAVSNPPSCLTTDGPDEEGNLPTLECTTRQLGQFDLDDWNDANALYLPSGAGTVTGPVNGVYTITLTWTDNQRSESYSFEVKPLP